MIESGGFMSIVSSSHVDLVRARKKFKKAYQNGEWDDVRQKDRELSECLNIAFEDKERDAKALVDEVERILHVYSEVVSALPLLPYQTNVSPKK